MVFGGRITLTKRGSLFGLTKNVRDTVLVAADRHKTRKLGFMARWPRRRSRVTHVTEPEQGRDRQQYDDCESGY